MKIYRPGDVLERRKHERVRQLAKLPRSSPWTCILWFFGLFFFVMFIGWSIWSMTSVVIPRLLDRPYPVSAPPSEL